MIESLGVPMVALHSPDTYPQADIGTMSEKIHIHR